ncbi:hypothetical protein [uncultured Thiothrix sp.]|uniref:hypothetical protein n=1 Tax=uncultured Thiothrix sp. TaxID=223185 RepID=UPI00260534E1|nr:hypothetical protein [uncultured Thiothrix sp.]HMT94163.1 hypothetical protein [Thiolinea sp.]
MSNVPLAEVLAALCEELNKAELSKDPKKPMVIDGTEVEITIVVTKAEQTTLPVHFLNEL